MPNPTSFGGDIRTPHGVYCKTFRSSDACLDDAMISESADIATTKVRHRYLRLLCQPNTSATAETRVVHVAKVAGVIKEVKAGSIAVAVGDSTVTVDVKINGVTALSGTIVLDSSNTAYTPELGTVNTAADDVAAEDVVTVVITISAGSGTLPTGVFVSVEVEEAGV